jgi:predicted Zn-dependent protease
LLVSHYDPAAAIALQEKFATVDHRKARLSFLSSHPSGEERIQNLRTIIQSKTDRSKLANSP